VRPDVGGGEGLVGFETAFVGVCRDGEGRASRCVILVIALGRGRRRWGKHYWEGRVGFLRRRGGASVRGRRRDLQAERTKLQWALRGPLEEGASSEGFERSGETI